MPLPETLYDDLMELSQKALGPKGDINEAKFQKLLQAYSHKTYPSTEHFLRDIMDNLHVHIPAGLTPKILNIDNDSRKDYIINVKYDRYALGGQSYTIKFYLGGVHTFGGGSRKTRDSCVNTKTQAEAGVLSCAQVPLTIQLLHHTIDFVRGHSITTFEDVEENLRLHLRWKIIGFGGFEVDENDLDPFSKTQITVMRGVGQPRQVAAPLQVKTADLKNFSVAAVDISM
ncbi:hypothetical protein LZL87_011669 [Fusarium oxysporum]|nr:hypothetical protein LZL87_011669 [Fusarium oxysporum]